MTRIKLLPAGRQGFSQIFLINKLAIKKNNPDKTDLIKDYSVFLLRNRINIHVLSVQPPALAGQAVLSVFQFLLNSF